ncbi:MAG TPA: TIM44-like domain-containing protein, partial [Albitalea sp.]|nr:TIM44-like domain-containing protein [Albitalea sp.]
IGLLSLGFAAHDVEAKRLGGGSSQGMKRTLPPQRAPDSTATPQTPVQPSATPGMAGAAATQAAAPRRSWLGPIAGVAGALGVAALLSHFGLGAGVANILTMVLLAIAAVFLVRFLLRRFGPAAQRQPQMQYAGASANAEPAWRDSGAARSGFPGSGSGAVSPVAGSPTPTRANLPPDFDAAAFERIAKMIFLRMQAANDAGDLNDLRQFSTPEMFAAFRLDLQDRGSAKQRTDVVKLDAEVLDWAIDGDKQVVSVRFHGLIREDDDGPAVPFDEVWHLVRPLDGSREWAIAGIQQTAAAH